jgi:hypothetical protein
MRFAAITLCVSSKRVFTVVSVYFIMTQSGNFWIHLHMFMAEARTGRWDYASDQKCIHEYPVRNSVNGFGWLKAETGKSTPIYLNFLGL